MIILHGTRLYGKVDQVPGLFYVATHFFYLQFIPLIPLTSYLVLAGTENDDGGFSGRKLGWHGKSILFTYIRLGLFLGGCILAGIALFSLAEEINPRRGPDWSTISGLAVSSIALFLLFWGSYRFTHASPTRALQLAAEVGIPPETVAKYYAHKLNPEDLEKLSEILENSPESMRDERSRMESV